MKDKSFVIKVGDLLQEGGKVDSIAFDHRFTTNIPNINKEGISGTIILRSLNHDSLFVNLENISCTLQENCDRCGVNYIRDIHIPEYISRFVISEKIKDEEQITSDEELFVINARDESIDLEAMIVQSIKLNDPFIKYCPQCKKELENSSDEDDLEERPLESGNIHFH